MEDSESTVRRWEDMEIDILVKIFQQFNLVELPSISRVCTSWRSVCSDPILWNILDLGQLKSYFIKIPSAPYIWVAEESNKELSRFLNIAMCLSRGSVNCMIFHFNLYLTDEHLLYVAKRSPHLKQLVFPAWNRITKDAMIKALRKWRELESLVMPSICSPNYVMTEIGINCKNFTKLKIMGPCNTKFVRAMATFLPKLRVLSIRCSKLLKESLVLILDCLKHLEILNISHCLLVEPSPDLLSFRAITKLDITILEKASRLRAFFYCQKESCVLCQRTIDDDGIIRWYKYEDGLWLKDEDLLSQSVVGSSLALQEK